MMSEELKSIADEVRRLEDAFLIISTDRKKKVEELEEKKKRKEELLLLLDQCSKAIEFVEQVSTEERQNIKGRVEDLVSSCLRDVFDDSYSIEFFYGMKRSKTSVEIYSIHSCEDGMEVRRQIDGIGGGLADMISLPLKLMVLLNDDRLDRIFIIDEPGKHLSIDHVPKFARFLQNISKKLGVQIIMSSHHTCMDQFADSINEIHLEGSKSVVERQK